MYTLVVFKEPTHTIVCAVFDEKGNEIWHTSTYSDLALSELNRHHFPISRVIHDDQVAYTIFHDFQPFLKKDVDYVVLNDISLLQPIANERLYGVGFARLVNRSFSSNRNKLKVLLEASSV